MRYLLIPFFLSTLLPCGAMAREPRSLPLEYEHYVLYVLNRNIDALNAYPYSMRIEYDSGPLVAGVKALFDEIDQGDEEPWRSLRKGLFDLWSKLPEAGVDLSIRAWQQAVVDRFLLLLGFELLLPSDRAALERMFFESLVNRDRSALIRFLKDHDGHLLDAFEWKDHKRFYRYKCTESPSRTPASKTRTAKTAQRPDAGGPLLLAHFGGFGPHPENSLAAFRLAVERGADGFECDLRLSRDHEVFMAHDDWLERVTGRKVNLHALDHETILTLELRHPFPGAVAAPEHPVLLKTVLDELGGKTLIWLELKPDEEPLLAKATGDLIEKFGLVERVIVSSFSDEILEPLRSRFPKLKIALEFGKITESHVAPFLDAEDGSRLIISANNFESVAPELLDKVQAAGLETSSFTVNRFDALRSAIERKITYIQTDRPDRGAYLRNTLKAASR